jgi:hypothetical protein
MQRYASCTRKPGYVAEAVRILDAIDIIHRDEAGHIEFHYVISCFCAGGCQASQSPVMMFPMQAGLPRRVRRTDNDTRNK